MELKSKKTYRIVLFIFAFFIFVAASLMAYASFLYFRKYNAFDHRANYRYAFDETSCRVATAEITPYTLSMQLGVDRWDTGFVEVRVNTNIFALLFEPYVDLSAGDLKIRQYLEKGANGARYLNISPFTKGKSGNIIVDMKGHGVTWDRQSARILLFDNKLSTHEKVLVLSPHPDDAEIGSFGYYSDHETYIVNVTAGEGGGYGYIGLSGDTEDAFQRKSRLRIWDGITIPLIGGVSPARSVNLGYFSNTLKTMHDNMTSGVKSRSTGISDVGVFRSHNVSDLAPPAPKQATWTALVDDLADILRKTNPTVIVAPHPMLDSHKDHQYSAIALFEAIRRARLNHGKIYFYANHYILSQTYPFGENDGIVSLPPWFDNNFLFESLYSHPLPPGKRSLKFYALESMHDLRPSILPIRYNAKWFVESIARSIYYYMQHILEVDTSFFRRSVRTNELFFVVPFDRVNNIEGQFAEKNKSP